MSDSTNKNMEAAHNLLFGVRRSIRYHNRRRQFFDRVHKFSTILSALSASATIISVLSEFGPNWVVAFASMVAVSSIIDLVVGTAQAARLHSDLARRFIELEKAIISSQPTDETLKQFTAQRLDIEADEPPPHKVLDSICHNELLRVMGYDESYHVKIEWYQRILCQFFDLKEHSIKTSTTCARSVP